jgi:hypothetical protein
VTPAVASKVRSPTLLTVRVRVRHCPCPDEHAIPDRLTPLEITIYGWRCATNTESEVDVGRDPA